MARRAAVARIRTVRAQFAGGLQRVIAVPPFVSRSLVHDLNYLQRHLAQVLEGSLSALPGTAVFEMEEVHAIGRELAIGGTALTTRVVP
jgi:hypothetical protein